MKIQLPEVYFCKFSSTLKAIRPFVYTKEAMIDKIGESRSARIIWPWQLLSSRTFTSSTRRGGVDASLLGRGDGTTFLASPLVLVCHPRLDIRRELGPQIHELNDVLVDHRWFHVYWILAVPPKTV